MRASMKVTSNPILDVVIIALLFLALVELPMEATVNGHDSGSQAAYEYWTLHGFAYGKDIFQNVGPLGFLSYPKIYTGFLSKTKLLLHALLIGSLIILLVRSSEGMALKRRLVFLIVAGSFAVGPAAMYVLLLLVSQQLMAAVRRRVVLLATALLAVLALAHGTYLFIALFGVVASIACQVLSQRAKLAATTAAAFLTFLFTIWAASGQSLANLPVYFYGMATFSNGYNDAMALYRSNVLDMAGFLSLLGCVGLIARRMLSSAFASRFDAAQSGRQLLWSGTELVILLIVWKHGIVRDDDYHIAIYFHYLVIGFVGALFARTFPVDGAPYVGIASTAFLAKCRRSVLYRPARLTVGVLAAVMLIAKLPKIENTLLEIIDISHHFTRLDEELHRNIDQMRFPNARALMGGNSIGYFGNFPAPMLYGGLNYVSMPSTVSFASWNDRIVNADGMFFREDQRAPSYLFFSLDTADGRLVAQDSALAQLEILHRYEVQNFVSDRLGMDYSPHRGKLFLRRVNNREPLVNVPISARTVSIGDWIEIPHDVPNPMWVRINVDRGFLASLVTLAYKPPQYRIEILFKNGTRQAYKFVPQTAATGFLMNPLILENDAALSVRFRQEYQHYLADLHPALSKVVRVRITCDHLVVLCERVAQVAFEEVRGLALGLNDDQSQFYRFKARQFEFDAEVKAAEVASPVISTTAFGREFFQFAAPSHIQLRKPKGVQRLTAFYGMYPKTYEREPPPFYSQIYQLKVGLDWLRDAVLDPKEDRSAATITGVELGISAHERGSQHVKSEVGRLKIALDWTRKKSSMTLYSGVLSGAGADGVELVVRLETLEGRNKRLYVRDFNPSAVSSDRGEQRLDLDLPNEEGTLWIDVNAKGNSVYDQFLLRDLRIGKPATAARPS